MWTEGRAPQKGVSLRIRRTNVFFLLAGCLGMALMFHAPGRRPLAAGHPRTFQEVMQTRIPPLDTSGKTPIEVWLHLAYKYKVPMALEHVSKGAACERLRLRLPRLTLRAALERIASAVPDYRVDFSMGIVDIYSPRARADPKNPFNVVVRKFDVDGMGTHMADAQLLCALSRQLDPTSGGCGGSIAGGQWGKLRITVHLANKRVYEILNAIVAQNGKAVWTPIRPSGGPVGTNVTPSTNFWYIYPLDPAFLSMALEPVETLRPCGPVERGR